MSDSEWLRVTRARFRWTQADLADKLGLTRSTIGDLENGVRPLDTRTRLAIERLVEKEQES